MITDQLSATWVSGDTESGIGSAEYCVGTQPDLCDIVGWEPTPIDAPIQTTGLFLEYDQTYYVNVHAKNGAGLWSEPGTSNGITALDFLAGSDGDGVNNQEEVDSISDPFDPYSHPGVGVVGTSQGFNLISLQGDLEEILDDKNPSAFQVLDLLGGPDKVTRIQKIDSALGLVKKAQYESGVPAGEEFSVDPGDGLIVYGKMDMVIPLTSVVCPSLDLHVGANLVGIPCAPEGLTAFQLLDNLRGEIVVSSIQRYNSVTGRFDTAAYEDGQPVGVDFQIIAGEGYFIHMREQVVEFKP